MIVLLPGRVKPSDRVGHHDYLAGCSLLAFLLRQTPGVNAVVLGDGAAEEERLLGEARSLVFFTGGGGKHALLGSPQRRRRVEALLGRGAGIVMLHQAVRLPPDLAARSAAWLGGTYVPGTSGRGHWRTHHREFPEHPATRGVTPWSIRDGWLNGIRFVDGMAGVTPLVWSGRRHRGSSAGGAADVVGWAYERPGGGRSFCFTGIDAHGAWSAAGVRRLVVNAILWSSGLPVPPAGAPSAVDAATLKGFLTPRISTARRILAVCLRRRAS